MRKPQELRKDIRKEQPTTIMTLAPTLSITAHTLLLSGSNSLMRVVKDFSRGEALCPANTSGGYLGIMNLALTYLCKHCYSQAKKPVLRDIFTKKDF